MIIDLSDTTFKYIFNDKDFHLPIRWDGRDFILSLKLLFEKYIKNLCYASNKSECQLFVELKVNPCYDDNCFVSKIIWVCDKIIGALKEYFKGFPATAYNTMNDVMRQLIKKPVNIYQKSDWTEAFKDYDPLFLFRVVKVSEDIIYPRSRVFHTPYNLRNKVSTSRYSIAGYPSLYLGTSVELCLNELQRNSYKDLAICSRFQLDRKGCHRKECPEIDVIELGIKPQDFLKSVEEFEHNNSKNKKNDTTRKIEHYLLQNEQVRESYLLWYPIIAACSFIRTCKSDPFAPEYVIPQLLMQWLRNWNANENKLFGLRYFSCASKRASDLGFNYVFPTCGESHSNIINYCKILAESFKLSLPRFIHEEETIQKLEDDLKSLPLAELDYVYK